MLPGVIIVLTLTSFDLNYLKLIFFFQIAKAFSVFKMTAQNFINTLLGDGFLKPSHGILDFLFVFEIFALELDAVYYQWD